MAGVQPELSAGFENLSADNSVFLKVLFFLSILIFLYLWKEAVTRISLSHGELAQLARASALQAECQGFKSPILH